MSLEDIKATLNKKYKSEVLGYGNNLPKLDRIPFSSARMNYLTRGGIPWPGVTEISGPEGGGKTTLLGDLTKQAQQMGLMCSFIDTENKAQPLDALILTPNGFSRMGDMSVGDELYGNDGLVHHVIGVYPQGIKDVYKVTFSDGTSTECCGEHLWTVQHIYDRQYMLGNNKSEDYNYQTLRLEQILSDGLKLHGKTSKKGSNKYYVPINKEINFSTNEVLLLDPYLLGVLIGDGGIVSTVGFTSEDIDLVASVSNIVIQYRCKLTQDKDDANVWFIRKDTEIKDSTIPNPIKEIIKELGLYGHHSFEKFIPKEYLFSSIENRAQLLRGLIDTDGMVKGTQSYHYCTTSEQLSKDVAFLARSLGCLVRSHKRPSYYKDSEGNKIICRDKYELHINTPENLLPFTTEKRQSQYNNALNKPRQRNGHFLKKSIEAVDLIGQKECQCIRTDNPSSLYITDEFIVTHNTDLDYWKWLGVDIDNLLTCKPTGMSGEDILQLQLDLMEEGVQFAGLDSVASLVPKAVLDGQMDNKTYCGSSGILSTFSQKLSGTGITGQNKIAFVGINQVRDKINSMFGGFQTPGGHFWRHACLCRLQVSRGTAFDAQYKDMSASSRDPFAGHMIEINMLKNQFSKNDRKYNQCTLHYTKGIDANRDMVDVAILMDIIHRAGAWYQLLNIETGEILCVNGDEMKFQGRANLDAYLEENPRITKWIHSQVMQHITED